MVDHIPGLHLGQQSDLILNGVVSVLSKQSVLFMVFISLLLLSMLFLVIYVFVFLIHLMMHNVNWTSHIQSRGPDTEISSLISDMEIFLLCKSVLLVRCHLSHTMCLQDNGSYALFPSHCHSHEAPIVIDKMNMTLVFHCCYTEYFNKPKKL